LPTLTPVGGVARSAPFPTERGIIRLTRLCLRQPRMANQPIPNS